MSVGLIMITDGRKDCFWRTLQSALSNLPIGSFGPKLVINDSADQSYRDWLARLSELDDFETIHHLVRRGFAGAVQSAWGWASTWDVDHIFHCEDDFLFDQPLPLADMAAVLDAHPNLVQLVLRRQAVNDAEKAAGGIVEQWPHEYRDEFWNGHDWLSHRLFFSTNPSLYRRSLTEGGWPSGPGSERRFTDDLLTDPEVRFGFWGKRADKSWVTHIGDERVGSVY